MIRIILASKSPRQHELLSKILPSFQIIAEETDETLKNGIHPRDGVRILSERKGCAVFKAEGSRLFVCYCTP